MRQNDARLSRRPSDIACLLSAPYFLVSSAASPFGPGQIDPVVSRKEDDNPGQNLMIDDSANPGHGAI
jgi:hypothetical protein